ncbi:MAG TPA: cupin domain-containing protein [Candidatus Elarobacter sp.]|nr:cupin domain-containing protein [Candidatus Elarobacter sp.]
MSADVSRRVHHVRPGEGPCLGYGGQVIHVKLSRAESGGELTVIEDVIPPQTGPPLHVHARENETYYILEGEFEFTCGEDVVRGGAGTFVHAPRGLPHRYFNIGETPGRMLFSFTPGGIEAFFGELTERKDELAPPLMMTIAAKYGITMIPPKT